MHPTDPRQTTPAGALALLGGEGLHADPGGLWQALAALRPGGLTRLVVIPAAQAAHKLGAAERRTTLVADTLGPLGWQVEPLPVLSREDAEDAAKLRVLDGADGILLTGGHPDALVATLGGTRLWGAVLGAWQAGCLLAGAGGAAAGLAGLSFRPVEPDPDDLETLVYAPVGGLGLLRGVMVLPYAGWLQPGLVARVEAICPPDTTRVEIDEAAALAHDGAGWRVLGAGSVSIHPPGQPPTHVTAGSALPDGLIPPPER